MFLRPWFIFSAIIIFSLLNGWAFSMGLKNNNITGVILSSLAIAGTFYFLHIYRRLRSELHSAEEEEG
ncbi:MAG: hypothetical protein ABIX01_09160 [Chitinophagaceae bacterium]